MKDITLDIKEKASKLFQGQLVFAPNFGLIDAMSCIQIMHPRMDGNILHASPFSHPLPILNANHIVSLIDRLIALEYIHLDGNLLAQTIYTCQVYIFFLSVFL